EQYLLQAIVSKSGCDFAGLECIRKQKLNRFEAVTRGGCKTIEKVELRIEHGQIGGKFWHAIHQRAPKTRRSSSICVSVNGARVDVLRTISRAVSSSSSSVAMAAAGDSCQTLGPRRSSMTARIGVPAAP